MAADNSSTGDTTTAVAIVKPVHRKPKQNDPAWAHAEPIPGIRNSMICLHCGKKISGGGITRFKYHLSGIRGQVEICQKVPEDIRNHMKKLVESLSSMENRNKRKRKRKSLYEIVTFEAESHVPIRVDPPIFEPDPDPDNPDNPDHEDDAGEETEEDEHGGDFLISPAQSDGKIRSKKQRYVSYLTPHAVAPISRNGSGLRDPVRAARLAVARWWYDAKVPFDGARSRFYRDMVEAVADAGPGFECPSYHDLRGPLLKEVFDEIKEYLFGIRNLWRIYGCSILVDRLSNNNGRTQIINFLISSARGTVFLKSVDVSCSNPGAKNESGAGGGGGLVEIFDEVVRDVGPENVVQFITDTDKDSKTAGKAVQDRYGTFFWSPCAAHCIDLMLENLSDPRYFSNIDETLKKARKITNFIYNRAWVLSLMRRDFTNGRDLTRPSITRFATHFLTLQCLLKFKKELRQMFACKKWCESEFGKSDSGAEISRIILRDTDFWTQCQHIVKVTEPLIRVLRLVDSDDNNKPSMGYLFESMESAKESIRLRMKNKASLCGPYLRVIDTWWDKQLSNPLHAAGCFLNPGIYFRPGFAKQEVTRGLLMTISRLVQDYEVQDMISAQLEEYKDSAGDFGLPIAVRQREKLNPVAWWEQFGNDTPELQRFAVRVLSQCCSASGRERNWNAFQFLFSKRQNHIEYKRLKDLVFVRYNLKLRERSTRKNKEQSDPISLDNIDLLDGWINEDPVTFLTGEDLTWDSLEPPVSATAADDQEVGSDSMEENNNNTTTSVMSGGNNNNNRPLLVTPVNCFKSES